MMIPACIGEQNLPSEQGLIHIVKLVVHDLLMIFFVEILLTFLKERIVQYWYPDKFQYLYTIVHRNKFKHVDQMFNYSKEKGLQLVLITNTCTFSATFQESLSLKNTFDSFHHPLVLYTFLTRSFDKHKYEKYRQAYVG